jgi:hypothetical protein
MRQGAGKCTWLNDEVDRVRREYPLEPPVVGRLDPTGVELVPGGEGEYVKLVASAYDVLEAFALDKWGHTNPLVVGEQDRELQRAYFKACPQPPGAMKRRMAVAPDVAAGEPANPLVGPRVAACVAPAGAPCAGRTARRGRGRTDHYHGYRRRQGRSGRRPERSSTSQPRRGGRPPGNRPRPASIQDRHGWDIL